MTGLIWRIAITVPGEAASELYSNLLGSHCDAISAFELSPGGDWLVQGFTEHKPMTAALAGPVALAAISLGIDPPDLEIERLDDIDWLRRNQESFPPVRIGRWYIYGSHLAPRIPGGAIPLRIDAATAFGTGEHPTTAGCLLALERLARRGHRRRVLDMGTGTGILAIASAKLWRCPVLGCDIDPHSVRVARENIRVNEVGAFVTCRISDGYRDRFVSAGAPYDLILANILARPLMAMAPDLARHLAPGGMAILSGLLEWQERQVLAAHRRAGLFLAGRVPVDNWQTLILGRS
jgi:ribosomal protein L11 methyltransferase